MIRAFLVFSALWLSGLSAWAAESDVVDTGYVNAQIVSSHDVVAPGQTFHVALRTVLDPHWHTYWRNPGDSGEPVQISWVAPDVLTPGDIIWPLPDTIPTGPIINYGFEGTPYFPVEFKVSEDAVPGEILDITADVYYLVCKDICVPEDAKLDIMLTVGEPVVHDRWNDLINHALNQAPMPSQVEGGVVKKNGEVVFNFANLPEGHYKNAHFFPFEQGVLDHSAPQKFYKAEKGRRMITVPGFSWDDGKPADVSGVLRFEQDGQPAGVQFTAKVDALVDVGAVDGPNPASVFTGIWATVLLAFLGGIILNLMPCVFPVISIKALSVAKMAHEDRSQIRREGWIYTAGVIATFLALTVFLLVLKSGGESVGWGFQLQSPKVVAGLAILLFVIGLNLLGVFEIGSGLQDAGGSLASRDGPWGTFFTGVLAVIVATPCSGPFMATAVGAALLSQSSVETVAIFMALAIGFALPFLLLAYSPRLLSLLPKPGQWMVRFRELLAFPMFATSIWLLWTLTQQAGEKGLGLALISMLAISFAIWLFKGRSLAVKILAGLVLIGGLILPFTLHPKAVVLTANMEAWSTERVQTLRAEGQAVFVDFTAAWCVTCKANKIVVLDKPDVQEIFTRTNTAFLVADWTNRNDVIANELARHGRSGIPLYLYYPPGHDDVNPVILPQLLSKNVIEDTLTASY